MDFTCTLGGKTRNVYRVLTMRRWWLKFKWTWKDVNYLCIRSTGWLLISTVETLGLHTDLVDCSLSQTNLSCHLLSWLTLSSARCWARVVAPTNGQGYGNLVQYGMVWLWNISTMKIGSKEWKNMEKNLPHCHFCAPQVPCGLPWVWTQATAVRMLCYTA
jgi:hypothetical protein